MKRTIHNFEQGSPEWLAHRAGCYNASELSAAMGLSSYATRTELLNRYANGAPEVDAATQKRFADGHRFEALARPWAEEIIGEELFPICVSVDVGLAKPLGASLDGTTMSENVTWEHKTLNAKLEEYLSRGEIPEEYWPQCEQGLMALETAERCLFMASKGTKESMRHAWYESRPEVRAKIIPTWQQFEEDLQSYAHRPEAPKSAPTAVVTLPSLLVNVDASEIKVRDNLADFGSCLKAYIDAIPQSPATDQDFVDCKEACKAMERAESALKTAREQVIAQTGTIEMVLARVSEFETLARQTRLRVEKLVTAREATIKDEIRREGVNSFVAHLVMLNTQLGGEYMPLTQPKFAEAMKGKRTIATLRNAVSDELARAKVEANQTAERIGKNLAFLRTPEVIEFDFLFADRGTLVLKAPEDFILAVQARIRDHKEAEAKKTLEALQRAAPPAQPPAEPPPVVTPMATKAPPWAEPAHPGCDAIVAAVARAFNVTGPVAAGWLLALGRTAELERLAPRQAA